MKKTMIFLALTLLVGCDFKSHSTFMKEPKLKIGYTKNISKEASNFYLKCLKAYSFSAYGETECQAETFAVYAGVNGENTIKYFFYLAEAIVLTPCTKAKTKKEKFMCGL